MRRVLRCLGLLLVLALVFGVGWAWPILFRGPLLVGQDAVSDTATAAVAPTVEDVGGRVIVARPPSGTAERDVLVVFYPGGLVRPQAYEWLARELAVAGYTTVIPEFAFDLAVTGIDRATALIAHYGAGKKVVLAGHSLGGAMAAQYLANELAAGRQPAAGLILEAAYPPDGSSLASANLKALVLRAENDGVADAAKVTGGLALLPSDATEVVVPGSVHAFFGRYGPQSGDGVPTVSRAEAEAFITAQVEEFLAGL
ncbi:MAG: alpha/beta hydrolase [Propionicimonas sp.]|uniref:alpha/beta hydrolase n=1 Tax=Propionicimonas sp. TaxID=1955623 RepID=UPI003D1095F8